MAVLVADELVVRELYKVSDDRDDMKMIEVIEADDEEEEEGKERMRVQGEVRRDDKARQEGLRHLLQRVLKYCAD